MLLGSKGGLVAVNRAVTTADLKGKPSAEEMKRMGLNSSSAPIRKKSGGVGGGADSGAQ